MFAFEALCCLLPVAHSGRVSALKFVEEHDWLISAGRDKTLQFYSTKTGRKLGTYEAQAWCMDVEYPFEKKKEKKVV